MKIPIGWQTIDAIKLAYAANTPILLEGSHGVGKSQIIEQAARQLGIECIVRDLSLMEPPDLIGLPTLENGATAYAPPSFLPSAGKGFLVFEELNRCERYMAAPCLQLLTARRLNDYQLPEGWLPVAAINPDDGSYETNRLDRALLSRFTRIEIEPATKEWLSWAARKRIHPEVRRYVEEQGEDAFTSGVSPRSYCYASNVLNAYDPEEMELDTLVAVVAGHIGDVHAAALLQRDMQADESPLTAEQILHAYFSHRDKVLRWVAAVQLDHVQASARNLVLALQHSDRLAELAGNGAQQDAVRQFLEDMPPDLAHGLKLRLIKGGIVLR